MKFSIKYILLSIILFSSCERTFFEDVPGDDPVSIFNHFWTTYDEYYANFELRGVDWDEVYEQYSPLITDSTTESELFSTLSEILGKLNDGHVLLIAPDREIFASNIYYRENIKDELFDKELIMSNYLDTGYTEPEDQDVVGIINNEIIYYHISHIGANLENLEEVLTLLPDSKGLILDLRHNQGGNFTIAQRHFTQFNDSPRLFLTSRTKNGADSFDEWTDWYLDAGQTYDKPIVVLADRYTVSAAERSVLMLRTLPQVTTVGDTTNGAISYTLPRELPNGWAVRVSTQEIRSADGEVFESVGIPPDIPLINDLNDMNNGMDKVLEKAIELLD